jgi:hypothetical protein
MCGYMILFAFTMSLIINVVEKKITSRNDDTFRQMNETGDPIAVKDAENS